MSEPIPPSGTCRISFAASNNLKSINQSVVIIYRLFQIFQRGFPEEDPGEHAGHVESQCPGVAGLRPGPQSQRLQHQQLPGRILPPFPDHNDENGPSPIEPDPPVAGRSVDEGSLFGKGSSCYNEFTAVECQVVQPIDRLHRSWPSLRRYPKRFGSIRVAFSRVSRPISFDQIRNHGQKSPRHFPGYFRLCRIILHSKNPR